MHVIHVYAHVSYYYHFVDDSSVVETSSSMDCGTDDSADSETNDDEAKGSQGSTYIGQGSRSHSKGRGRR